MIISYFFENLAEEIFGNYHRMTCESCFMINLEWTPDGNGKNEWYFRQIKGENEIITGKTGKTNLNPKM